MSTELARRDQDAFELGKVFKASGMFPTMKHEAEAVVKIIAGREFGLGPLASMTGIHMVDGKPTLAANLIAGQIKRHPHYDYRVIKRDEDGCELEFFEHGKSLGIMAWGRKDANAAGLLGKANWKKYPRDMYFARCLTSGARTFCPDVLGGSPIYTAEELGADAPVTAQEPFSDEIVTDAEVVAEKPENATIDGKVVRHLFDLCNQHEITADRLAWSLLSVGVQTLPQDPSKDQLRKAVGGLSIEQAFKLEEILSGTDAGLPGSGETTA
ncbi:MAG: hypothetical protein RB191_24365 [Terriglobia bacterium]|nr:hypothetical protein [Terriglobia bacterium]